MTMPTVYAFDAYGTLFDVHAAAARHRDEIGANWERLSQLWRTKHLEYTWIHAQTHRHTRFSILTERSLDYAIATVGGVPPGVREKLLGAYRRMAAFPEVPRVLRALRERRVKLCILTNGDDDMIADAVAAAGLDGVFDAVLSVQLAGVFKPAAAVYQLVCDRFAVEPSGVRFMSSNRWDIAGANVFGFATCWVNRAGLPDEYPDMPADEVVENLKPLMTRDRA
jgi:2-haloacid dehalogenase